MGHGGGGTPQWQAQGGTDKAQVKGQKPGDLKEERKAQIEPYLLSCTSVHVKQIHTTAHIYAHTSRKHAHMNRNATIYTMYTQIGTEAWARMHSRMNARTHARTQPRLQWGKGGPISCL